MTIVVTILISFSLQATASASGHLVMLPFTRWAQGCADQNGSSFFTASEYLRMKASQAHDVEMDDQTSPP
jgi:hypothetical protein